MKLVSLPFIIGVFISCVSIAADQCKFKALNGSESGECSDDAFTQALWYGDVDRVKHKLERNSNLLFSCSFSPSFVYRGTMAEIMNPLIFSVCHSRYENIKGVIQVILNIDASEINCETPNLKINARKCLSQIPDAQLRSEVESVMKKYGMK